MLLPKQTAFRKCSLGYSSLLIITVLWVSHCNQVLQKACFNKRELWPYSHCNASLWFLQRFSLGKENLQCNKWEKNLSGNPSMKLLMKKEDFFCLYLKLFVNIWLHYQLRPFSVLLCIKTIQINKKTFSQINTEVLMWHLICLQKWLTANVVLQDRI